MAKGTLIPNGDGTFALSTGKLHLNRVSLPALSVAMTCRTQQATVAGYEDAEDGSWSVTLADVKLAAAPVLKVEPTSWFGECLRQYVQAAIDDGLWIPPENVTADGIVAGMTFSPIGSKTAIGNSDVDRIELGCRVEFGS
ncbi:hypothetical protein MKK84_15950 [Methylobacterium sp. E-065]|uniref:hypothetical protein n=1 Tax=Methylobacterium sp. E-065 TaxID=2836583 RepID=UPI001FBAD8EB|nr:hypothetical protein [Methylobacterium sp. E-065]MCJ2018917.1 hypothetical protein [Methylobacterium sp. E-065]